MLNALVCEKRLQNIIMKNGLENGYENFLQRLSGILSKVLKIRGRIGGAVARNRKKNNPLYFLVEKIRGGEEVQWS